MRNILFSTLLGLTLGTLATAQEVDSGLMDLLKDNCSSCHNGIIKLGGLNVSDQEQVTDLREEISESILSGRMPVGRSDFANTPDGQEILEKLGSL